MESAHEENCADEFPNPVQLTAINFIVGEYASSTDEMKLIAVNMSANKPSNKLEILLNIELDMNAPCSMGNNTMPIFEYILTFYSAHITADIFRAFIDAGADVNARNCFGAPILHSIVNTRRVADYAHIIEFLLDNGADIYANEGDNVFKRAADNAKSNSMILKLLIDRADINHRFYHERTILMYMVQSKYVSLDIIDYIIKAGADVNATCKSNTNALDYLIHSDRGPDFIDVMKLLIAANINVNIVSAYGNITPLMNIIRNVNDQTNLLAGVELLLKAGADVDSRSAIMLTALNMALMRATAPAMIDVIMLLINAGANLDSSSGVGLSSGIDCAATIRLLMEIRQLREDLAAAKTDLTNTIAALVTRSALFNTK